MANFLDVLEKKRKIAQRIGLVNLWNYTDKHLNDNEIDYIGCITLNINNNCNLNCAYCTHFAPLVKETIYISMNQHYNNLIQLKNIFGTKIPYIRFSGGGECLLHPRFNDILKITRQIFDNSIITVLTNGIILQNKDEDFYNLLKLLNIDIVLTKYPINLNINQIKAMCNQYKIPLFITTRDFMYLPQFNFNGKDNYVPWSNCDSSRRENGNFIGYISTQLNYNGDLFLCDSVANIYLLEKYFNIKTPIKYGEDYFNIYDSSIDKNYIISLTLKPQSFCKYCPVKRKYVNWKVSDKDIREWIVES